MKLIACNECHDVISLINKHPRKCLCGKCSGKYLDDNITAVVSEDSIVCGIDNIGFNLAKYYANSEEAQQAKHRVDYFFTGWIPNHPGEIIRVKTVKEVDEYPYEMKEEDKTYTSTSPVNET